MKLKKKKNKNITRFCLDVIYECGAIILQSRAEEKANLTTGEENFPLSIEARELMISSSKLWPLAAGPVIHGGSFLPVLHYDCRSLTGCVDVCTETPACTGK